MSGLGNRVAGRLRLGKGCLGRGDHWSDAVRCSPLVAARRMERVKLCRLADPLVAIILRIRWRSLGRRWGAEPACCA